MVYFKSRRIVMAAFKLTLVLKDQVVQWVGVVEASGGDGNGGENWFIPIYMFHIYEFNVVVYYVMWWTRSFKFELTYLNLWIWVPLICIK